MGSIQERLQSLQEARELEAAAKEAEEKAFREKKAELDNAEREFPKARRAQFEKFQTLKNLGIMDMIKDATGGLDVDMPWPLSREEVDEQKRAREEEVNRMAEAFRAQEKSRGRKQPQPASDLPRDYLSPMRHYAGWRFDIPAPCVTKDLEWDTTLRLRVIKQELKSQRHDGPRYPADDRQVGVSFDGFNLSVSGAETVFSGSIFADSSVHEESLEEAFVLAFDNMKDISKENRPDFYSFPSDLIGLES